IGERGQAPVADSAGRPGKAFFLKTSRLTLIASLSMTDVTKLINGAAGGDALSANQLYELVYAELRAIAGRKMASERAEHTLQATALVHEAYLRLGGAERFPFKNRAHFFASAAEAMRRILVDSAR